jgi:pimeloyl-ACP methyl ester carboxylesterase
MINFNVISNPKSNIWIVFIHGAGGSIRTWNRQVGALQQHAKLLLLDLRDHGASEPVNPSPDQYDFALISSDIKEVMDHLEISKAHFITLSLGTVLIQDFSMRYPSYIGKVVMAGGVFKANFILKCFIHTAKTLNNILPFATMYRLCSYILMPRKRNQTSRKIYQREAQKLTRASYMRWVSLSKYFIKSLKLFSKTKSSFENLIIMGGQDYVFLSGARKYSKNQPKSTFIIIPTVGHICNIEGRNAFNNHVIEFLFQNQLAGK